MEPSTFQRKMWWAALTALAIVVLLTIIALGIFLVAKSVVYLQVLLVPLSIAGIMAYLLEPVLNWFCRRGLSRAWAIAIIFFAISCILVSGLVWVAPSAYRQGAEFIQELPRYVARTKELVNKGVSNLQRLQDVSFLRRTQTSPETDPLSAYAASLLDDKSKHIEQIAPTVAVATGNLIKNSLGGVVGTLANLLSLVLVPIFLFFFLLEGPSINSRWMNYLPLRASPLKSELVVVITAINEYLVNFFRGQLIVSLIDGALIGLCLLVLGLDFAILIGLMVGILAMIPYIGITICWIPAILISIAQFGDFWHPLIVTVIFVVINQIDGMFIAPRIVGDSVGLHPFTVIVSVIGWSIVIGGFLGALLAVPLTATLKVLFTRYFWDRPIPPSVVHTP